MKRKYSAKDLYKEAQSEAERSVKYKTGPAQIEVIKKYSGAARLFEEEGDFYKAKKVLEGAAKYLRGSKWSSAATPRLVEQVNDRLDKLNGKRRGLERHFAFAIFAIASFVTALFFISFNLTGYFVLGQTQNNLGFFAVAFFILGLVFVFFYSRNKK